MMDDIVTVFGGTGFLGRRIVRQLRTQGFRVRVVSRHPERGGGLFETDGGLQAVAADIHDAKAVAHACAGAHSVVNAVSLYVERGRETFRSVHVEAAERVAEQAGRAGALRLIHVSGIGADRESSSRYIRSRGEGEEVVRGAFAGAIIVRPAVMFGPDDKFLTTLVGLLGRAPIYPLFARGRTRLQPAFVQDVAEAIVRCAQYNKPSAGRIFECAGPQVYTYRQLLETICVQIGRRPAFVPVPFAVWHALASAAEWLPSPPVTRNQVELMEIDNVASPAAPGFHDLGIVPQPVTAGLGAILRAQPGSR